MRADTRRQRLDFLQARSPQRPAEECEWLIDNAEAYDRVLDSVRAATESVWIMQLALDVDCVAYDSGRGPAANVAVAIAEAAELRNADVRILMNQTLLLDTVTPLRRWLAGRSANTARVRGISRFPQLLHAKMVIVDAREIFLIGSPFVNGYWDDSSHVPADARRPRRELGGRPLHDVSLRLTGPVVSDAITLYREWWNAASPNDLADVPGPEAPQPGRRSAFNLVSTSPANGNRSSRMEILHACLDGIARARSLIYVEHQYLSARPVVDALTAAVAKNRDLEVVIVLNQNPDVTAYRRWQNDRLKKSGLLEHDRVGVFSLWTTEASAQRIVAVNQVFVHSKVLVVDDSWAMVGSANLDGVSLYAYGDDFAGPLARRLFRNVRNFDVNVVIRDGIDGVALRGTIAALRTRLWSEHLGASQRALQARPSGGWLSLWRKRAKKNVAALDANNSRHRFHGLVMPYSLRPTPVAQLADMGVRARAGSPAPCFDPGWMEVYFSPNWVRNMFL